MRTRSIGLFVIALALGLGAAASGDAQPAETPADDVVAAPDSVQPPPPRRPRVAAPT